LNTDNKVVLEIIVGKNNTPTSSDRMNINPRAISTPYPDGADSTPIGGGTSLKIVRIGEIQDDTPPGPTGPIEIE
jgi:hypothetical protein